MNEATMIRTLILMADIGAAMPATLAGRNVCYAIEELMKALDAFNQENAEPAEPGVNS